ncbi:hypothetical protein [Streptomyces lushanensis]|uniref:hypothetical protein n=1 Tax=Streptomyces lushanensis TaxID=1434255 RepID=UPI0014762786|nr:hypothetical protein [Streptomyces lushanensis]
MAAIARFASVERFLDVRPMELLKLRLPVTGKSRQGEKRSAPFHTDVIRGVFSRRANS